jgi:diguanylate cyclase (GGDEF)-like protein
VFEFMRTVIVEDSAAALAALSQVLETLPGFDLLGTAGAEDEAVELIQMLQPDLVLLDLGLASGSGLGVLRRLREAACPARIVVLTNRVEQAYRAACLAAGANAFFDKSADHAALLDQLQAWMPPQPANEPQRLEALHTLRVLDTPPEASFDAVTELAARLLGVPIVLVSLIDEQRQWFKSRVGLSATQTSRAVSFCGHAINSADVFVVEDALRDPRFADNPLVVGEPRVRFYAGAPLTLSGGEVIGTLCAIDHQPRQLGDTERAVLQMLARHVVVELELRRQVQELIAEMDHRRQAEQRYMQLATRDPLTGLPNRAAMADRLEHALGVAARKGDRLAFMFMDLDRFKLINDTLGHAVGDTLLQAVAERLLHGVREADTVARLGGDEFALLLEQPRDAEAAVSVVQKLLASLGEPIQLDGQALTVRASVGIALYPEHGETADQLMRHADLAMYQAKQEAARGYCVYERRLDLAAQSRLTLEQDLRGALSRGELALHYQPQVSLAHGGLTGVEALVRWHHPRQGLVSPARFIPLAEETGLILDIGRWVLQEATRQLAAWRAAGFDIPRMSVNVSPLQLRADLLGQVENALRETGLAPGDLEIEITETAIAADGPLVLDLLSKLRALGVGVAVDDFGVGFSSLAMLRRLPVSTLKIDRGFVQDIARNRQDATITHAIVCLAQALDLRLVAEGVERTDQRQILGGLGCEEAQGYLFSPALDADAFIDWLDRSRGNTGEAR